MASCGKLETIKAGARVPGEAWHECERWFNPVRAWGKWWMKCVMDIISKFKYIFSGAVKGGSGTIEEQDGFIWWNVSRPNAHTRRWLFSKLRLASQLPQSILCPRNARTWGRCWWWNKKPSPHQVYDLASTGHTWTGQQVNVGSGPPLL